MVDIKEVTEARLKPSEERLLDAEEIEKAAGTVKRPTAKMQLESLAKKVRKEAAALMRVEKSHAAAAVTEMDTSTGKKPEEPKTSTSPEPVSPAPALPNTTAAKPLPSPSTASSVKYTTVDRFSFDPGEYNTKFVSLYIPLPGVGDLDREHIQCDFAKDSFDLVVSSLKGKSYRLVQTNLEKDIDMEKSKYIVKPDKIIVKLAKQKSEYGSYDHWSKLSDPKKKDKKKGTSNKDNPMSSINELMKDMYDSGDDKMKKMIGETMLKQRNGELGNNESGGMDNFADM
jgi:calcyclin binding protein